MTNSRIGKRYKISTYHHKTFSGEFKSVYHRKLVDPKDIWTEYNKTFKEMVEKGIVTNPKIVMP